MKATLLHTVLKSRQKLIRSTNSLLTRIGNRQYDKQQCDNNIKNGVK